MPFLRKEHVGKFVLFDTGSDEDGIIVAKLGEITDKDVVFHVAENEEIFTRVPYEKINMLVFDDIESAKAYLELINKGK